MGDKLREKLRGRREVARQSGGLDKSLAKRSSQEQEEKKKGESLS